MNLSLLRLVCVGLFLFAVTSVSFASDAGRYKFLLSDNNLTVFSDSTTCASVGYSFALKWNELFETGTNKMFLTTYFYSGDICSGFTFLSPAFGSRTTTATLLEAPPVAGTISDYSIQDILICGFAFLSMCAGWGVGIRLA